jgi:hypothetical protein
MQELKIKYLVCGRHITLYILIYQCDLACADIENEGKCSKEK